MERLDRVLANRRWCLRFPKAQCLNSLAIGSDHSPIELILNFSDSKGRRRFRFEQMWLERRECFDVIKAAWEGTSVISSTRELGPKLMACRRALIHWSRTEFKNNVMEINKAREALRVLGTGFWMRKAKGRKELLNLGSMLCGNKKKFIGGKGPELSD